MKSVTRSASRATVAIAALILTCSATSASAQLDSGFYAGVGVGQGRVGLDCAGTLSCEKSDTASKGFVGYMFTPMFGIEGAYNDFGKAKAGVNFNGTPVLVGLQPRAYALFGVAQFPVHDRAALFGKLGAAYVDSKATVALNNNSVGDNDTTTSVAGGVGAQFRIMNGLWIRTEWERVRAKFGDQSGNVDFLSLSLRFTIPN
jgi:OOP family OmpA-OmpF porin